MIQPGGAMALFVLRLAGLLSLEKSLGDNSTSSYQNDSLGLPLFAHAPNSSFAFLNESSVPDGHDVVSNGSSEVVDVKTPKFSFLSSGSNNETLSSFKDISTDQIMTDATEVNKWEMNYNSKIQGLKNTKMKIEKEEIGTNEYKESDNVSSTEIKVPTTHIPLLNSNPSNYDNLTFTLSTPASLPPRSSTTGFSTIITQHATNTSMPFFAHTKPSPKKRLLTLVSDKPKERNVNFHELEAPNSNFVSNNFQYYDLNEKDFNSSDNIPNLTSRSLVNPIAKSGHEKSFSEYTENSNPNHIEDTQDSDPTNREEEISEGSKLRVNDTLRRRGIGPVMPSNKPSMQIPVRNNPYPYGPKVLPDHAITYKPDIKLGKIPLESLFPDKDIVYDEEDYAAKEEKDEPEGTDKAWREERKEGNVKGEKILVQTEAPMVLFHFDKPGYSPKLPEASLPPTRAPTPSDPWDCSPRCPSYSLLDWNQDYDIRQYPVTTWVSTVIIAENRILAELEGYMRVQDYFYGLNARGQLLNMTVPFVTQIKHGRHPGVLNEYTDFTVSLYLNHIDDPMNYDLPTPISNEVLIDRLEPKTAFVAGFEANVWDVTESFLDEKASLLMHKLRQNGEAFLDRYFYLASYSRPELYQPVYYELWIYATSFRDNPAPTRPIAPRTRPPPNKITKKAISKLCRGVECPPFEVLRTYRYGIQKRRYFDGLFATSSPGVCEFTTLSVWKGFMPLHLYKHGINSHMEVIEATRPIGLVHIKEDSTSTTECPQNLTMAIYLPKRLHSNPPLTGYDAPTVSISALQDVVVYSYTVGGYLLEPGRVRKELADLKHRLTEFGACYKHDEYYVVVYDFIIRYHGRQNEIWVVGENCKATRNG